MGRIYLIGNPNQKEALSSWFPVQIDLWTETLDQEKLSGADVIFGLISLPPEDFSLLCSLSREKLIFVEAVSSPLAEQIQRSRRGICPIYGINGHPFFLGKPPLEISFLIEPERATSWLKEIGVDYVMVKDQAGMVRPRVLAMIINEAFWMLTEGQAEPKDMDTALKLGTNYPYGPFEWANLLGESYLVQVLEKLGQVLGNETYKIAPELRKKALYNHKL